MHQGEEVARGERMNSIRQVFNSKSADERDGVPSTAMEQRWAQLCHQAATESDPQKLISIVAEINLMVEQRGKQLMAQGK